MAADLGLYVVADGMGGHAGGDQASQMAVTALHEAVRRARLKESAASAANLGEEPLALTILRQGARTAGETIFDLAQQDAHLQGMGTTLTALLFNGGRVHLAHVGDSRAFLFRDGRIEQLTEDHSWINEQVKAGLITDEEAKHSKFKHIITRSVGFERDVSVDVMSLPVLMGDVFVVCSDGLSNYLETEEIGRLLTTGYYGRVPRLLVDIANERGGDDNITVVLVYVANDAGPPLVEDLSRPDPNRATTHPGPDPTLSQSNASDHPVPRAAPPQASPPQASPPQASPPQASPPQASPPQASPPQAVPPQAATPAQAPPIEAPPIEAPQGAPGQAAQVAIAPAGIASAAAGPSSPGTPGEPIDPEADTAPADVPGMAAAAKAAAQTQPVEPPLPTESAAPEELAEEPTPEAGVPAAPKPSEPS